MEWRMTVMSESGVARTTLTMDDAIASLDSFSVDRAGNCLEASFTALPSAVGISSRDIITLQQHLSDSEGKWYWWPMWRGVIVQAGNPRSERVQSYRAVGLKQRFYEVLLREPVIEGGDVASMAHEVAALAAAVIHGAAAPSSFATTDFTLGDRHPGLETMGSFMDALAASVGAFTVPTGGSYSYDSVNYAAGESVPAVVWGVDANGIVFFERPQATALDLDEANVSTRVAWTEASAEEYVNSVTLVYATEVQSERLTAWGQQSLSLSQAEPLVVTPLSRVFTSAAATEETSALITLPAPLDYMERRSPSLRTVNYGTMNNAENSNDNDLDTYATMLDGTQVTWGDYSVGPVIWRVRMAWYAGFDITVRLTNYLYPNTSTLAYTIKGADRESDGEPIDLWLPSLPLASVEFDDVDDTTAQLSIIATQNTSGGTPEVYEVEYYRPDCDGTGTASELLAEAFLRPIPSGVATVDVLGALTEHVTQAINLTTATGEALALSVERIEYSLTTDEGAVTRYHTGQPYASGLEAQRVVLEQLARRANAGVLP